MVERVRNGAPSEYATYAAIIVIFGWWFYDLHFAWNSIPEYNFGWIVLMLVTYLVWDRWSNRPYQDRPLPFWRAAVPAVVGFPLVLVAELYKNAMGGTASSSMALSLASVLFISAILLYGIGVATWRHFLFPVLFCFVAVPIPKVIWNPVVLGLQGIITALNVDTLNGIGIPAVRHANVIQLPNCMVGIDEACSGVRSLQSSVMAGMFLGCILLRRTSLRVFLLIVAVFVALLGNFARSLYLSITAYRRGLNSLAEVHDTAGWSVLVFTAIFVGLAAWLSARLERRLSQEDGSGIRSQ